jgi:hypothetical protein
MLLEAMRQPLMVIFEDLHCVRGRFERWNFVSVFA